MVMNIEQYSTREAMHKHFWVLSRWYDQDKKVLAEANGWEIVSL